MLEPASGRGNKLLHFHRTFCPLSFTYPGSQNQLQIGTPLHSPPGPVMSHTSPLIPSLVRDSHSLTSWPWAQGYVATAALIYNIYLFCGLFIVNFSFYMSTSIHKIDLNLKPPYSILSVEGKDTNSHPHTYSTISFPWSPVWNSNLCHFNKKFTPKFK